MEARVRAGLRLCLLPIAALLGAAAEPAGPESASAYIGPHSRIEIEPGRRINLLCMGSGKHTVLFDSGGSDWSVIWALVQPEVAKGARACAYDRAGMGHSDPAPIPRSPAAIVEDLHKLIRAAGLKRPLVLVGHSLGGFNVKLYAALYPEDVAGMVLVDPAEERGWDRTRGEIRSRYGARLAARAELLDSTFLEWLVSRYRSCAEAAGTDGLDPASPAYKRCTDPVRPKLGPEIAAERMKIQATAAYQSAQASEIVNSVYGDARADRAYAGLFRPGLLGSKPVIVLSHGLYDRDDPLDVLSFDQGVRLHRQSASLSRRGRQRIVPDSHHNIEIDAPKAIVEAVAEVLAGLRTGAPRQGHRLGGDGPTKIPRRRR
jgi:pimeloyl-ACP methyl ester carboxylesterase